MESSSTTTKDDCKQSKISLPEDIVMDIFSRLPVKSVFQLQCTSKKFSSITSDPHFIDAHLQQSARLRPSIIVRNKDNIALVRCSGSLDSEITVEEVTFHLDIDFPNPCVKNLEIAGSCNGLVLAAFGKYRENCYLWNLAILNRSSRTTIPGRSIPGRLPSWRLDRVHDSNLKGVSYGFGYCTKSKNYKIVRILSYYKRGYLLDSQKFLVEVLTYEKDVAWRELDFSKFDTICYDDGLTINGVVYWDHFALDDHKDQLLTFDLEKEEFRWTFCPMRMTISRIMEFRGFLCVCAKSGIEEGTIGFDLWVLKDQSCWEKVYTSAEFLYNMEPVQCLNDHCLLLLKKDDVITVESTYSLVHPCYMYDMECAGLKKIPGLELGTRACDLFFFHKVVESIVSVHGPEDDFEYNSDGNDQDQN